MRSTKKIFFVLGWPLFLISLLPHFFLGKAIDRRYLLANEVRTAYLNAEFLNIVVDECDEGSASVVDAVIGEYEHVSEILTNNEVYFLSVRNRTPPRHLDNVENGKTLLAALNSFRAHCKRLNVDLTSKQLDRLDRIIENIESLNTD